LVRAVSAPVRGWKTCEFACDAADVDMMRAVLARHRFIDADRTTHDGRALKYRIDLSRLPDALEWRAAALMVNRDLEKIASLHRLPSDLPPRPPPSAPPDEVA
jgi:hypothetical protein